jgi:hypothetical protein
MNYTYIAAIKAVDGRHFRPFRPRQSSIAAADCTRRCSSCRKDRADFGLDAVRQSPRPTGTVDGFHRETKIFSAFASSEHEPGRLCKKI